MIIMAWREPPNAIVWNVNLKPCVSVSNFGAHGRKRQ